MRWSEALKLLLSALLLGGCVEATPPAPPTAPAPPPAVAPELEAARWGDFRSRRFDVRLPLPDGRAWRIDDHRTPWLEASHPATGSSLALRLWREDEVVSRKRCEIRARSWRPLPEASDAVIVERRAVPLPAGFDTELVVALVPAKPGEPLVGFVSAFGGWAHRCFAYVFVTKTRGRGAEQRLGQRLATIVEGSLLELELESELDPKIPKETIEPHP